MGNSDFISERKEIDKARPYVINAHGHIWKLDENGLIDIFGYVSGQYCNGPICINCGYGFCHHHYREPQEECV